MNCWSSGERGDGRYTLTRHVPLSLDHMDQLGNPIACWGTPNGYNDGVAGPVPTESLGRFHAIQLMLAFAFPVIGPINPTP